MTPFLAAANPEELKNYCREHNFPAFRANQIDSWLHTHCVVDPDMMKNLPADLKAALKQDFHAPGSRIAEISTSPDQVSDLHLITTYRDRRKVKKQYLSFLFFLKIA